MKNLIIFFLLIYTHCYAQQKPQSSRERYTISGFIKDAQSGESLIAANVYVKDNIKLGTSSNVYGFYSLTLPMDVYTIVVQYLGYSIKEFKVELDHNIRLNVNLAFTPLVFKEVVVTGERQDKNIESTEMGKVDLSIEKIEALPVLFGEVDILKTIQLLPGVQSSGEGNTGLYVRGGGPDQNLILLDEAVVYNPAHLFGFFSVFNPDAIKNVTLIKGIIPANYGGRLSSVLDITMKEGNNKSYHAVGGIGFISSRLTVEGPIVKNKSSFIVSGRRTYIDQVSRPVLFLTKSEFGKIPYFFYDLNAKVNYRFSDKDRLYFSSYFGRDVFSLDIGENISFGIKWGNAITTLRWNHLFSDKLFMNISAIYSDYKFEADQRFETIRFIMKSGIQDGNLKIDLDYLPGVRHSIKFGTNYTYHVFTPRTAEMEFDNVEIETDNVFKKFAHDASIYILNDFRITENLKVNAGLRGVYFLQMGPYNYYTFNDLGRISDSVIYEKNDKVTDYKALEPRMSGRYSISSTSSVKGGITFTNQFVHLVSNSFTSLPFDVWVPSSLTVKPQKGVQYSVGYFRNFSSFGGEPEDKTDNMYETSVEIYYKDLKNQIEFGESYFEDIRNKDIEYEFVFGSGRSYGIELFIKKSYGKAQGWIGYTLSKTTRLFKDLNDGNEFPARFDRRHDLSIVGLYQLTENWSFSSVFVYGTGQRATMPERFYLIEGDMLTKYGPVNAFKMEPYHRMDISAVYEKKKQTKKFKSSWIFSVYNVYNRQNPFFYYIEKEGNPLDGSYKVQAKKVSIFPILPSVTWNFKF